MATPAKKGKSVGPKKAVASYTRKGKPKAPLRGYSDSTPQGRADAKKEAERKAKIKKMDNAGKEKAAKPVDKAKQKAEEKERISKRTK